MALTDPAVIIGGAIIVCALVIALGLLGLVEHTRRRT